MPNTSENTVPPAWRPRLYLPAYYVSDAARYAQTSAQTVSNWYHGASSLGPTLTGREKRQALSYLQLVEVAFVSTFRRLGVSLQRIRSARAYAAQVFKTEFPFADWFKTEGTHLLLELQQIDSESAMPQVILADAAGQTGWEELVGDKFAEFDYEGDGIALKWHVRGRNSPIIIIHALPLAHQWSVAFLRGWLKGAGMLENG